MGKYRCVLPSGAKSNLYELRNFFNTKFFRPLRLLPLFSSGLRCFGAVFVCSWEARKFRFWVKQLAMLEVLGVRYYTSMYSKTIFWNFVDPRWVFLDSKMVAAWWTTIIVGYFHRIIIDHRIFLSSTLSIRQKYSKVCEIVANVRYNTVMSLGSNFVGTVADLEYMLFDLGYRVHCSIGSVTMPPPSGPSSRRVPSTTYWGDFQTKFPDLLFQRARGSIPSKSHLADQGISDRDPNHPVHSCQFGDRCPPDSHMSIKLWVLRCWSPPLVLVKCGEMA